MERYPKKILPKIIYEQMKKFETHLENIYNSHTARYGTGTDLSKRIEFIMKRNGPYYRNELALRWKRWRRENKREYHEHARSN